MVLIQLVYTSSFFMLNNVSHYPQRLISTILFKSFITFTSVISHLIIYTFNNNELSISSSSQYTIHSISFIFNKMAFFFASFNKLQHIDRSSIKQFFNNIACFMSLSIGPTSSSNIPITFSFFSFTCYGYVHTFNPPQILVVFFLKLFFIFIN